MAAGKLKLAVLASGRGSNLQALIDAARDMPDFPGEIVAVLSNIPDAAALERAQKAGIPALTVPHKGKDRQVFEDEMLAALAPYAPDAICLAGFMRILTSRFLGVYQGRVINIHPSLLPKYQGLDTHARALEAGDSEAGCTVHIVTDALDDGPVLVQKRVPVLPGDTPDTLAARVLAEEHGAYVEAIYALAARLSGN